VLKRKRSRPSDWWAAPISASTPPPQDEPSLKKRGRGSFRDFAERKVQEAPAAGNRGKRLSSEVGQSPEDRKFKASRQVRPSNTEDAFQETAGKSVHYEAASKKQRVRRAAPQQEGTLTIQSSSKDQALKRKRGRPVGGQLVEATAYKIPVEGQLPKKHAHHITSTLEIEKRPANIDEENAITEKRRGRPNEIERVPSEAPVEDRALLKKRHGHPSISRPNERNVGASAETDLAEAPKAPRRGRSSNTREEPEVAVTLASEGHTGTRTRRRSVDERRNQALNVIEAQGTKGNRSRRLGAKFEEVDPLATKAPGSNRRGRGLNDETETSRIPIEEVEQRTARGGRSNTVFGVEPATSANSKSRHERRHRGGVGNEMANLTPPTKPRKRLQEPNADIMINVQPAARRQRLAAQMTGLSRETKRKQSRGKIVPSLKSRESKLSRWEGSEEPHIMRHQVSLQEEGEEAPQVENLPSYQHLTAVTRQISRQTIDTKWEPLPTNCIELISHLLSDIQRPVVVRLSDERRRTQASTALQMVTRRLINKISKGLPFPQGTLYHRENDFDFEKILDHTRALEGLLTPALHANELLDSELRKVTVLLEADLEILADLEANAKAESTMRKQAGRKLHSLLRSDDSNFATEGFRDKTRLAAEYEYSMLSLVVLLIYFGWLQC
jgi:hypothetical protein